MNHKEKCEELRQIRVELAKELGIEHLIRQEPCDFQGECTKSCPVCDFEEQQLLTALYELKKEDKIAIHKKNQKIILTTSDDRPKSTILSEITTSKNARLGYRTAGMAIAPSSPPINNGQNNPYETPTMPYTPPMIRVDGGVTPPRNDFNENNNLQGVRMPEPPSILLGKPVERNDIEKLEREKTNQGEPNVFSEYNGKTTGLFGRFKKNKK